MTNKSGKEVDFAADDDEQRARAAEKSEKRPKRRRDSTEAGQLIPEKRRARFVERPTVLDESRAPRSTKKGDKRRAATSTGSKPWATTGTSASTNQRSLVDDANDYDEGEDEHNDDDHANHGYEDDDQDDDQDDDNNDDAGKDETAPQPAAEAAKGQWLRDSDRIALQQQLRLARVEQQLLDEELRLADEELPPLSDADLAYLYARTNTLDEGNRSDDPADFNGGVFVVKRRTDGLVCVEKRLRPHDPTERAHLREIRIVQRLSRPGHANVVGFIDAFATWAVDELDAYEEENEAMKAFAAAASAAAGGDEKKRRYDQQQQQLQLQLLQPRRQRWPGVPKLMAGLYMPYCTLGSLNTLILRQFSGCMRHVGATPFPEGFVWHVLRSLVAALVYLMTGSTSVTSVREVKGWRPVIHRDIRSDNIFLQPPPLAPPPPPPASASAKKRRARKDGTAVAADEHDEHDNEAVAAAAAAAARAAATATYPSVVLGDFGMARVQPPDEAQDADEDGAADDDDDGPTVADVSQMLFGHDRWAPSDDELDDAWSGKGDVWRVGCVAQHTARMKQRFTEGADRVLRDGPVEPEDGEGWCGDNYSAALSDAVGLALEPRVRKRPYAEVLLLGVNKLFAQALPTAEPLATECQKCAESRAEDMAAAEEEWKRAAEAQAAKKQESARFASAALSRPKKSGTAAAMKSGGHKKVSAPRPSKA
jgi:serine/threonine protein kinase